jgi:hypothetical protein
MEGGDRHCRRYLDNLNWFSHQERRNTISRPARNAYRYIKDAVVILDSGIAIDALMPGCGPRPTIITEYFVKSTDGRGGIAVESTDDQASCQYRSKRSRLLTIARTVPSPRWDVDWSRTLNGTLAGAVLRFAWARALPGTSPMATAAIAIYVRIGSYLARRVESDPAGQ